MVAWSGETLHLFFIYFYFFQSIHNGICWTLSQELGLIHLAKDVNQVTQVMNKLFVKFVGEWAFLVTRKVKLSSWS